MTCAACSTAAGCAQHALLDALPRCTVCTAHGPDPACVEHGEALRAWQKRNGT